MSKEFCHYCHQEYTPKNNEMFCNAICQQEYNTEQNALDDGYKEILPTESKYAHLSYYEPNEWDVQGGL